MAGHAHPTSPDASRSVLTADDPTLRKIAHEIAVAEMLLVDYLKEMPPGRRKRPPAHGLALERLRKLVLAELEYLRKVKRSDVVSVAGNLATFRSADGEFLVTVVPEEELRLIRGRHPFLGLDDVKPRFAKPVVSLENCARSSSSVESVYYDAFREIPVEVPELPPGASDLGRSIHGLLNYIFASTIGRMDAR